ncbi:MAG: CYTH domain-containing protein [Deltaproteobacteria bacterium]|nr:CYTH domain-containing protein [Deltaproteobacteria bacterium]
MSVEIEFKFRVTNEAELATLEEAAGGERLHQVAQHNTFLDTPTSSLDKAKLVLRLRSEGEVGIKPTYTLTAKGPGKKSAGGTLSKKAEEEIEIDEPVAKALLDGTSEKTALEILGEPPCSASRTSLLEDLKNARGDAAIKPIGAFANLRTRVKCALPTGENDDVITLLLEFDRTTFPGEQHHFEVEVEVDEKDTAPAGLAMRLLLKNAEIDGRAAPGKAKRFFRALRGESID